MADAVKERQPRSVLFAGKQWRSGSKKMNDRSLNTTVWLKFESDSHDHVNTLSCKVSRGIKIMRNYYPAFEEGTSNVRTSSFKRPCGDRHAYALFRNSATNVTESPIVTSFLDPFFDGSYHAVYNSVRVT
jgi:hypothetical protein